MTAGTASRVPDEAVAPDDSTDDGDFEFSDFDRHRLHRLIALVMGPRLLDLSGNRLEDFRHLAYAVFYEDDYLSRVRPDLSQEWTRLGAAIQIAEAESSRRRELDRLEWLKSHPDQLARLTRARRLAQARRGPAPSLPRMPGWVSVGRRRAARPSTWSRPRERRARRVRTTRSGAGKSSGSSEDGEPSDLSAVAEAAA
jgi:hypothetical protein